MKYRRVRTPKVIQMEAVECGVASLSIILRYYGRYVPLETLRAECGVSRDGSNAFNLIKTAANYGLIGEGVRKDSQELKEIQLPAILFWGYNHFLVLEGFGKDRVYLNDPAIGPRFVSEAEFLENFVGIAIVFQKGPDFKEGGKPPSLLKQLQGRLINVYSPLGFLFTTGLCLILPGFVLPAMLRFFIDTFFSKNVVSWQGAFLNSLFLTAIFAGVVTALRYYYLNRLNNKLSICFSSDFLWHLLRLPMSFYDQRYTGEIAYRMTLNDSINETLTGPILFALVDLIFILFYSIVMFSYDALIAWIAIVAGIVNLATTIYVFRSRANDYARLQQQSGKSVEMALGGLFHIESIKAKAIEADFFSKWESIYTRTLNIQQEIGKKDVALVNVPLFFQAVASAILLGYGSYQIVNGAITVGMLMALQLLLINFLLPIQRFVNFSEMLQNMKVDLDRLNDVLNAPIDRIYTKKVVRRDKNRLEGALEFKNVTFGYLPLSPPLLENLSFRIAPGQRLAIVGPTGSGKSTIRKLASGLFHPWSGEILYDGVPLDEISKDQFCNSVATIDQEIFLFEGTIRENLTFWNPKVPEEMLVEAAQDALIHEEIILRGGYDTQLIEGGRNLSGGQRQRLEIARALLYSPSLLILDEATSSLDGKVEHKFIENLRRRGCSALMMAHRLSSIQDCSEILVLEKGKVVQRGTHESLKSMPGVYRDFALMEKMSNE